MPNQVSFHAMLEEVEISAWADLYKSANRLSPIPGGVKAFRHGSALISMVPDADVLALNRVLGLGSDGPVASNDIDKIVTAYREGGAKRLFVQLPPNAAPGTDEAMLKAGFVLYNYWVKLHRPAGRLHGIKSDLRVERIGPEQAESFARIIAECFDWDEKLIPWVGAIVDRQNWHCYMAYDGDRPAATGAFYVHGDAAWIDMAATSPEFRGRGAQSALLQRRFDDIVELGLTNIVVETAQQTAEKEAPSYRNMIRYGFTEAYVRPNYLYKF